MEDLRKVRMVSSVTPYGKGVHPIVEGSNLGVEMFIVPKSIWLVPYPYSVPMLMLDDINRGPNIVSSEKIKAFGRVLMLKNRIVITSSFDGKKLEELVVKGVKLVKVVAFKMLKIEVEGVVEEDPVVTKLGVGDSSNNFKMVEKKMVVAFKLVKIEVALME
ncbi:unnamed protein product [Dovyalis caffra]|uniref:Uncharacterized protein n=1 Tax=Dovyalis caffra TaxID=77055 RepID=A0AAV1R782_9ROSI|nr:unnamed protein product [Dovyalis caffra]